MNDQSRIATRSGGRAARRAARAAALPDHLRPVRPGMEGGRYKPLSDADLTRIHNAALDALEQIGLADAPDSGVALMTGAGATQGDDGRIRFPRALVVFFWNKRKRPKRNTQSIHSFDFCHRMGC